VTDEPTIIHLALQRLRSLLAATDDRVAIQAVRVALGVPEAEEAETGPPIVSLAGLKAEDRREVLRTLTAADDVGLRELPRRRGSARGPGPEPWDEAP